MQRIVQVIFVCSVLGIALAGCGGGGGSPSGTGGVVVDFGIDEATGPYCHNGAKIRKISNGKQQVMSCEWDGATYDDKTNVHVTVSFVKTGSGPWMQYGEPVVSGGYPRATSQGLQHQ